MYRIFVLLILATLALSCNRYKPYKSQYTFRSVSGRPDFADFNYWAAHPWKKDPSDSVPAPLMDMERDSAVDVFFIHPTSFTQKRKKKLRNADINDWFINAKTDYSSILYQASVFNASARVFAPRYRQGHIGQFFSKDTVVSKAIFDTAYEDVKQAFEYYMSRWNKGRPIIIASHSQGSKMALRLLKDYFENKPLHEKLVVAYVAGWPVPKEYFTTLKMCNDSSGTGCLTSWRTLRRGFVPFYLKNENGNAYATNPLTWTTTSDYAGREMNKGSVLTKFNKIYTHTTDAQVTNGLLYVKKPKFPWSFIYITRNYHIGDINLFYINIRENVKTRIRSYQKK